MWWYCRQQQQQYMFYYMLWEYPLIDILENILAAVCFKRAVCRYCFDMKPFNILACFITKCDALCYDTRIKMADHGKQCTIMYKLQWHFSWHTMSVLIGKKDFMCGITVKLNGQGEQFARILAIGRHWRCTYKYTFNDVQQAIYH